MEQKLTRLDGGVQPVEVVATTIPLANGPAIQVIVRDITERKRAEAEREKLARLIECSHDFIGTADLDGKITYLNVGARRMIGLPARRGFCLRQIQISNSMSQSESGCCSAV